MHTRWCARILEGVTITLRSCCITRSGGMPRNCLAFLLGSTTCASSPALDLLGPILIWIIAQSVGNTTMIRRNSGNLKVSGRYPGRYSIHSQSVYKSRLIGKTLKWWRRCCIARGRPRSSLQNIMQPVNSLLSWTTSYVVRSI